MQILETLGRPNADETFLWITELLEKRGIPYQITGGVAAKIYGALRDVNDIDVELPDDRLIEIVPDVEPYILDPLAHVKDERWDLDIIVLERDGQMVDASGAYNVKICDAHGDRGWIDMPADLSTAEIHRVCGKEVPVVAPAFLVKYKRLLMGDHQKRDVEAVERFLRERQV